MPLCSQPTEQRGLQFALAWRHYRQWWAACGLLLIAVTWPLWNPNVDLSATAFPRVPLVRWVQPVSQVIAEAWLAWIGLLLMLVPLVLAIRPTAWPAKLNACFAAGFTLMVVLDQHRLQPWAYQFAIISIVLATARPELGVRVCRWLAVSIYAYSALGKFDHQFVHGMGQQFAHAGLSLLGIESANIPAGWFVGIAIALPAMELAVAWGLAWQRTRLIATGLAVGLHLALLILLGPFGLRHELGVLVWNLFFIGQACLLFGRQRAVVDSAESQCWPHSLAEWLAVVTIGIAIVWPLGESSGWCDHWLAWGLYSPRNSRTNLFVRDDAWRRLPSTLQELSAPADPFGDWHQIDIDGWSLREMRVPNYPQARFHLAVAIALAERFQWREEVRVERLSQSDRWRGERHRELIVGLPAIQTLADEYWANARPLPPTAPQ